MPASLSVLLAVLTASIPADPSPAALTGVRFGPPTWEGSSPAPRVAFPAPGEVEIFDGDTTRRCAFTAEGSGYLWALSLRCPDERVERTWTWLPSGVVQTDLIEVPDGEIHRLPEPLSAPDPAPAAVPARATRPTAPRALSFEALAKAGPWRGADGQVFAVSTDGDVTIGGHRARATLARCVHVQVRPPMDVPCLQFPDADGRKVAFALLGGFVWVEGTIRESADGTHLEYEGWQHGRFFGRAP